MPITARHQCDQWNAKCPLASQGTRQSEDGSSFPWVMWAQGRVDPRTKSCLEGRQEGRLWTGNQQHPLKMAKNNRAFSPTAKVCPEKNFQWYKFHYVYNTRLFLNLEYLITEKNPLFIISVVVLLLASILNSPFSLDFEPLVVSSASSESPHGTRSITLYPAGTKPFDWLLNSSQLAASLLGLLAKSKHSISLVGVTSSIQGVFPILAGGQTLQANY